MWNCLFCYSFKRPNCFQIVVQHFSEEQYIFYFAGEVPEQAQVIGGSPVYHHRTVSTYNEEMRAYLSCADAKACDTKKKKEMFETLNSFLDFYEP